LGRSQAEPSASASAWLEWVVQFGAEAGHVSNIARCQRHAINLGCCRQQCVDCRERTLGAHASPFIGGGPINRKNARGIGSCDLQEPFFEGAGLTRIGSSRSLDAFANFAQYQNTEIEV